MRSSTQSRTRVTTRTRARFPEAVRRYDIKHLTGNFADIAQALGEFCDRATEPGEIVPAIQRALEMNRSGKPVLLEFITKEEGEYSKFQWS